MQYLSFFKKALKITWKNKYLWIFGAFLALAGGGVQSNFSFDKSGQESAEFSKFFQQITSWTSQEKVLLSVGLIFLLIFILALLVLTVVSQGAIISSIDKINQRRKTNFKDGVRQGLKNFWPILWLGLIIALALMIIFTIFFSPTILLLFKKFWILGTILAVLGVIIFIPLLIIAIFIKIYGFRYLVLKNKGVIESIKMSFNLFLDRWKSSLLMGILLLLAGLAVGLAVFTALIILTVPFFFLGLIAYLLFSGIGLATVIVIATIIFLLLAFAVVSVFTAFKEAVWTLFFKKIV